MFIKNEDLEILKEIELKLWNNKDLDNYLKLFNLIEKLLQQKEKTNEKNWKRIKEKRKTNKNYARPKKEV